MLRVLVADDHPIVRKGLRQTIAETTDIVVADEAADGHEVVGKVVQNQYDVVLLDISMPGIHGIDVLKEIKGLRPDLPVLVLSMHPEEQYGVRCLKAGASGYLVKESSPDELVSAIRKVAQGGKYVSSTLAERLASRLNMDTTRPLHEALSDREYQVMQLIASGKTVKEISLQLQLSVKTISTYRHRVLEKMQMRNNAELTHYAIQNDLV